MEYHVEERSGRERGALLDEMYRQRYEVFIRRLRWELSADPDREVDQFDHLNARYLLLLGDEAERLYGSLRLLPTNGPHVLSEIFPSLCAHGVPKSKRIWEVSRMCVSPTLRPQSLREYLIDLMAVSVVETALLYGVEKLTFVVGSTLMQRVISMGWDIHPLGLPQPCGRELITAFAVDLSPATLRVLNQRCEASYLAYHKAKIAESTQVGAA